MLIRQGFIDIIRSSLDSFPVVALLGPRQSGKTTLARALVSPSAQAEKKLNYFDLEDDQDLSRLNEPLLALEGLTDLVIIDEVQRLPHLFSALRVLSDRRPLPARFLILGSASRELIRQSSESLAGRIKYIEISPFHFHEIQSAEGNISLDQLWLRGGFPPSLLAATNEKSLDWRKQYIRTYLEQDIPNLGIQIPAPHLRRFWMMLSHYHGQIFNASEIAQSLDISDKTARRYLDILSGTFMVRQLQPWIENTKKRQIKRPKIFFQDSGLFHSLQGITNPEQLTLHPKLGASWEGFALEQVIGATGAESDEIYFWGVHSSADLDLLIIRDGKRFGFEVKHTRSPAVTDSMRQAMKVLRLDRLTIVFRGDKEMNLESGINALPLHMAVTSNFK